MPPVYSGSAEEWSYLSIDTTGSMKSVEFIIDNFEIQMKKTRRLESHQFTFDSTLWHIYVYPESEQKDNKGHVGVFIHNDNEEDLSVKGKMEIGAETDGWVVKFDDDKVKANRGLGWPSLCSHQDCKALLIDGKLEIKLEMKVLKEKVTLIHGKGKSFDHIPGASCVNLKIFEDKACTDFRVICSGKSFPCHKVFLMARSSVFKAMIEGNMKEANEGSVELKNCTEAVGESFVKFFYTGLVDEEILKENAISFLDLGEQYDLAGLKAIAEQTMIANLNTDNMLNFFQAGDLYKAKKIKAAAKSFLRQNRRSLLKQEGWKDVLKEGDLLVELFEFFSMD